MSNERKGKHGRTGSVDVTNGGTIDVLEAINRTKFTLLWW